MKILEIPIDRSRPFSARTDAENGYLQRSDNTGKVEFDAAIREKFKVREQLKDGRLSLSLEPIEGVLRVGDQLSFRVGLVDPSMAEAVYSEELTLEISDIEKDAKKESKKKKDGSGSGEKKTGDGDRKPTRGLPRFKLMTRDGRTINGEETEQWPEGFSEYDGGDVEELGEQGFLYKINYDNAYHLKYRLKQRGETARDVVTAKFILGMRIVMLGFEHALREKRKGEGDDAKSLAETIDVVRLVMARAAASTVLAIAENLPKIVDASSIQGEEVE